VRRQRAVDQESRFCRIQGINNLRSVQPPRFPVPVDALHRLLAGLRECVVLRNADIVANLRRGGDVDVLVSDPGAAERTLMQILGTPGVIIRRSYVIGYFYRWGHVDLLPRLEWRGAVYLDTDTVLQQTRKLDTGQSMPRLAHEALVCWFSSLLWGGFFKDRYRDLIVRAAQEDGEAFRAACNYAAGQRWGRRLWAAAAAGRSSESIAWVKSLRRAVWWQAFRRDPVGTVRRHASFWKQEITLRREPPLPWIAFLGPDGSGKSSVISAIASRLGPPLSSGVRICHWRPGTLRKGTEGVAPVTDPHGKPPRGHVVSTFKLGLLLADWLVGYWCDLAHVRAKGQLLIFDRHYVDILVDAKRYRYGGPRWLASLVGAWIPAPDILIVLDAPVDVLRRRKQEVSEEETARQRQLYQDLSHRTTGSVTIDATPPLDVVVGAVERIILDHMARVTANSLARSAKLPHSGTAGTTQPG
jgi:thymidylate kinase